MRAKMFTLIMFATIVAATLLQMRQQRFEAMHEMATLHRQMDQDRKSMWKLQTEIADAARPPTLLDAIARAELALEPVTPQRRGAVLARGADE